jgi:hypothetical protein
MPEGNPILKRNFSRPSRGSLPPGYPPFRSGSEWGCTVPPELCNLLGLQSRACQQAVFVDCYPPAPGNL